MSELWADHSQLDTSCRRTALEHLSTTRPTIQSRGPQVQAMFKLLPIQGIPWNQQE